MNYQLFSSAVWLLIVLCLRVFVCLFFFFCLFGLVLSVVWVWIPPFNLSVAIQPTESPHQYHVYRKQELTSSSLCAPAFVCFFSNCFFFFRCLCAQSCVCDTAECAVSPVRWYVWIVIGWLVSLRGSSRSKGRCSGAAVGELEWSPPATALSLWASSSKRCLVAGRRLQAPGALMLGKDAWDTEKRVMCMSVFVCVLWGDPK